MKFVFKNSKIITIITIFITIIFSTFFFLSIKKRYEGVNLFTTLKNKIIPKKEKIDNELFSKNFDVKELKKKIQVIQNFPSRKRTKIIEKVILPEDFVKITTEKIGNEKTLIKTNFYGISTSSIITHAKSRGRDCLNIYIQGHRGNPFNFDYHNKLVDWSKEFGCDILSMSMIGLGLNSFEASFPIRNQTFYLTKKQAGNHWNYRNFHDIKISDRDALSLFLTPHYYSIKKIINDYKETNLIGISGGGWYVVWLSSIIPEIDKSLSFAGSMPIDYQIYHNNTGDWEQTSSKIYDEISYWELYALMKIGKNPNEIRNSYLIYNDKDPCCFSEPYISHFKNSLNKLSKQLPTVIIDKNSFHSINPELAISIIRKEILD